MLHAGALRSDVLLPETETRWLRIRVLTAPAGVGLARVEVRPVEAVATANDFFAMVAREAPRGSYPRGFSGEQTYWTIVGVDEDTEEALVSGDGAVEVGERGFTIEPFVHLDDKLWTWADVAAERTLVDGDLPIPIVVWPLPGLRLETTVLATGQPGASSAWVRYRLRNAGDRGRHGRLWLTIRPFQVNPPTQHLTVPGGVAPIRALACGAASLVIEGRPRLALSPPPELCAVQAFDEGGLVERLASGDLPRHTAIVDEFASASGALAWGFDLAPGEERTVVAAVQFAPAAPAGAPAISISAAEFEARLGVERAGWRAALDRVAFELPAAAQPLANLARTSIAWVLVHRDGAALQPGSRAYARSWIRDGALSGEALLRMGHGEAARDFAEWYAPHQQPDGQVPCCVDRHGASPVPEHDSHGEFLHLVREVQRYTGDTAFALRMLPHVEAAVAAIERCRRNAEPPPTAPPTSSSSSVSCRSRSRTRATRPSRCTPSGTMPSPIAAWPMRPLSLPTSAAGDLAARILGAHRTVPRRSSCRDRTDTRKARHRLSSRLCRARRLRRHLFDRALDPGGLVEELPRAATLATFERYWREILGRRDELHRGSSTRRTSCAASGLSCAWVAGTRA